jgi:hypothetical protein
MLSNNIAEAEPRLQTAPFFAAHRNLLRLRRQKILDKDRLRFFNPSENSVPECCPFGALPIAAPWAIVWLSDLMTPLPILIQNFRLGTIGAASAGCNSHPGHSPDFLGH